MGNDLEQLPIDRRSLDSTDDQESDRWRRRLDERSRFRSDRKRNHWARLDPDEMTLLPKYKPLPYLKEAKLIQAAQNGDVAARNEVWLRNARMVLSVANQFHIPPSLLPDAIQEGNVGLCRAIEKFDVERLNAFSTYAWTWIWQRIRLFLTRRGFSIPIPAHLFTPYLKHRRTLNGLLPGRDGEPNQAPDARLVRIHALVSSESLSQLPRSEHPPGRTYDEERQEAIASVVENALSALTARQRKIVVRRYGLLGGRPRTLEQIGQEMGVTKERIRQIQKVAERRLGIRLRTYSKLLGDLDFDLMKSARDEGEN
jgi:RNA polymerase primary sigma factor